VRLVLHVLEHGLVNTKPAAPSFPIIIKVETAATFCSSTAEPLACK
jgi:hypothetical protein